MSATTIQNITAIAPATPAPPPPIFSPVQFPSEHVGSSNLLAGLPGQGSAQDTRPTIELIVEDQQLVAILLPRPLSQAQLLIAEFLMRPLFRLRIDLSMTWNQWRVYASPLWHPTPEAQAPAKPTGPKLFFA